MTWMTISAIVIGVILIFISSPTSALVGWMINKFALQPKLDAKDVVVSYNGTDLEEAEKNQFNEHFNGAQFLGRNHIFPGNEKMFLQPETSIIPYVIKVKNRNKEMHLFVYIYEDHIEVVKQWKKKVAAFSITSEYLQNFPNANRISE